MTKAPPLQILFKKPLALIKQQLQSTADFADDAIIMGSVDSALNAQVVQHGSLAYTIEWSQILPALAGYRAVFFDPALSQMTSMLSLSLSQHLAGGERLAPIAQSFLAFGARLAKTLSADAVVWNPAQLVVDPTFFIETVESYADGGAFPVLAAVDFDYQNDEMLLQTSGLSWFSGQEIALQGKGMRGVELARRAVRLIHDIAVNGPVAAHQYVADLDSDFQIELSPPINEDGVLMCQVRSKTDAKGKALTLH